VIGFEACERLLYGGPASELGEELVAPHGVRLAPVLILSPHLDDAAFSVWHVFAESSEVTVLSVFAGVPEEGFVTPLDRSHGALDSAAWVRRRRREDIDALGQTGAAVVHLDLLDGQYRGRPVEPDELTIAIDGWLRPDAIIYAPLGVGGHPDHLAVARWAVHLRGAGREVRLFADTPYYLRHGLPSWLGDRPNPKADDQITDALAELRIDAAQVVRSVTVLRRAAVDDKLRALRCYATEFDPIDEDFRGVPSNGELMRHEVHWTLP
jgi:LmbE family N-acetylglucosaminyl deacetylase